MAEGDKRISNGRSKSISKTRSDSKSSGKSSSKANRTDSKSKTSSNRISSGSKANNTGRNTSSSTRKSNEYCLDDADEAEKQLILNGTTNDRLNCLALLCARNPSDQNYKQLLQFCENQRNDVIYSTLKLIRDLIKEAHLVGESADASAGEHVDASAKPNSIKPTAKPNNNKSTTKPKPTTNNNKIISPYIKSRIIKSFEMGTKNQHIKDKVVEILGVLARADIYAEDCINILISRLLEKGKVLKLVEEALKSLFSSHESLIFSGIEDFYYKNDSFRCQLNALKFMRALEKPSPAFFSFYDSALTSLDESYPQEHRELMIELLVNGLSRTVSPGDKVTEIELVRGYMRSSRTIVCVLNLLMKTGDSFTENYVLRVSRTTLLRGTKHEPEFLNLVYKLENRNLFSKLVDSAFYCSVEFTLALMLMAYEKAVDVGTMFSLRVFGEHYNPVVREVSRQLLRGDRITVFDPFDRVYVESLSKVYD